MESIQVLVQYILKYGTVFIFLIVFCEYCNLPGLPGGVIFPAIGVFAAQSNYSLIYLAIITVIAGVSGSLVLYYIGYYVGNPLIEWLVRKFPKISTSIEKVKEYCERFGKKGIFICRLLPVVRTIVSLISGTIRENVIEFVIYSACGIAIWNCSLMFCGYITTKAII